MDVCQRDLEMKEIHESFPVSIARCLLYGTSEYETQSVDHKYADYRTR